MVGMQHKIFQSFVWLLFSNVFMLIFSINPHTVYKLFFQEEFLHREGGQALEGVAQEGGGLTIPRGVQEMSGCGPSCSSLVEKQSRVGLDYLGSR